ncbi:MAG: FAD-dependent oxidoreductase [Magnetospirillum sp.]|nr:FAD-dependent oxidoreductase [Magnetospirillum sp.]
MSGTLHVVGAGLAGLACAVAAARAGARVVLHESAGHAGGRCRSFRDATIDRVIDNGTHLLLGVNRTALAFANCIGGDEAMGRADALFPFLDVATGERWSLSPASLAARPLELMQACGLPWTARSETVAMRLRPTKSYRRIWEPLCVAALNTSADDASARLFAGLLRMAVLGGTKALVPWTFDAGLSAALVAPAVATLATFGAELRFRHRLLGVGPRILEFDDGPLPLGPADRAVLALPPWILRPMMDGIPNLSSRAIVNAHFRLEGPAALPGGQPFLGVAGGLSQWLALRGDVLSVTVSAADRLAEEPAAAIADALWREVAPVIGQDGCPQPATRIMKERRATIAHTPDEVRRRPGAHTSFPNLYLAGDWLAGPWPCTIEAAVASGLRAARLALGRPQLAFAS